MRYVAPLLALAGCVDGAGVAAPPPVDEMSCEVIDEADARVTGPDIDVLFVISDAPSMQMHRDTLRRAFEVFEQENTDGFGMGTDLHLGVIGPDGFTGILLEDQDPWFTCPDDPEACRHASYDGALADAIESLARMPPGAGHTPLLQRLDDAFERAPVGFFRPEAQLAVFVITDGDDASNWDPSDYAVRLSHRESLWQLVRVVAAEDAPRLEEFASWLGWGPPLPIAADGWWNNIAGLTSRGDLVGRWLDPAKTDLTDIDADEPGLQIDCLAEDRDGVAIPRCRMAGENLPDTSNQLPCWWMSTEYTTWEGWPWPYVEREGFTRYPCTTLRCACAP
jgi:hypothetical protein